MNSYLHLMWKEYRAVRLFWVAVVALAVLLELLAMAFAANSLQGTAVVCGLAFGAPVLFAFGAAGASFAMEKEEGTFDFLRAAPVAGKHLLVSKLAISVTATVAMYLVLWPVAIFTSQGTLSEYAQLDAMLKLWLVAALEAVAWGTLFSLVMVRPLTAVILAILAATTSSHLLAMFARTNHNSAFELIAYVRVAPWRALLACCVLVADVVIGLRWLGDRKSNDAKRSLTKRGGVSEPLPVVLSEPTQVARTVSQPDRSARLGHLLWQHWRQSKRLMLGAAAAQIAAVILLPSIFGTLVSETKTFRGMQQGPELVALLCMFGSAALVGSFVFMPDQERRNYRFFAEHNVPARTVWLTRLLPWMAVITFSTLVVAMYLVLAYGDIGELPNVVAHAPSWGVFRNYEYPYIYIPPIGLGITVVAISFAAGQWISMLVRSGIMAGFLSLVLAATLCGWVLLMNAMEVSFWWSVFPIFLALIFATWLRAPDWILERATRRARGKAIAVVAVPALVLLIAVPVFRVKQVPLVPPGFSPEEFVAEATPEAVATGELYRNAAELYKHVDDGTDKLDPAARDRVYEEADAIHDRRELTDHNREQLRTNEAVLQLILEATRRPSCLFGESKTPRNVSSAVEEFYLLVKYSGWQLEGEGKLDEALERYESLLQLSNQLVSGRVANGIFEEFVAWSAAKDQTSQRIRKAIAILEAKKVSIQLERDALKSQYIQARRAILDDPELRPYALFRNNHAGELLWGKFMPWENDRAARVLNWLTETALARLDVMQRIANQQDSGAEVAAWWLQGFNSVLPPIGSLYYSNRKSMAYDGRLAADFFSATYPPHEVVQAHAAWLKTTRPDLSGIGAQGLEAAHVAALFESHRRAALIVLALQAYRLDHGELPEKLSTLAGDYLQRVPLDLYSGLEFLYFPHGVSEPNALEAGRRNGYERISYWKNVEPGKPGIWCTSPVLEASQESIYDAGEGAVKVINQAVRYRLRNVLNAPPIYSIYEVLEHGSWFPLPPVESTDR